MTVVFHFQGAIFEWDPEKANSNVAKHGIDFEEAVEVFFDPFYQGGEVSVDGERRDFILGYSLTQRMLLVVYTERGRHTRIISARPATRQERKLYEEA